MMREIRKKSPVPVYGLAGVWLVYCLFFPMYRLSDFLILIGCSVGAFAVLSILFPGKTEYVKEPEKPVSTGNAEIDALLAEGKKAVLEMERIKAAVRDEAVCAKIGELIIVTEKIFNDVKEDPADLKQIRRFADFYLPTTLKLLNAYDRMGSIGEAGENITSTMQRITAILDTTLEGYRKQLDALFANQALDIETDIVVLKDMLKREGLTGKDF
jgi:5-bromo-4-chloroindolyl phosphate hydrolysis protein